MVDMTRYKWIGLGLGVVLFVYVLPVVLARVIPFDWWMDIRRIEVTDMQVGQPLFVAVDRDINRNFEGQFRVNVRRVSPTGGVDSYCTRYNYGESVPYQKGAVYPPEATLRWFMDIPPNPPCEPPLRDKPGKFYLIVDYWIPILGGFVTLHDQHQSNTFSVYEGEKP